MGGTLNLLKETEEFLSYKHLTLDDVVWIGCPDFKIKLEDFIRLADIEYHNTIGYYNLAADLIIVGKDWWLERTDVNGFQHWTYKTFPQMPERTERVNSLIENTFNKPKLEENIIK